jgi:adenylosuccinate synthase
MKVDILLGLQWGDEGKGKIVDFLAPKYNVVARFQGGPNAGHTLEFDGIKHVLHQIPSGIFRESITNVIGNGVVLDPVIFKSEVEQLIKLKVKPSKNLYISKKAQLILPTHRLLDAASEKAKGKDKIGSTLKGIGPTYQDKIGRQGLRVGDILLADFEARYITLRDKHIETLRFLNYDYELEESEEYFFAAIKFLKEFELIDSEYYINEKLNSNGSVLAEGAQGSLLDIDFGSYPFVTSSNTMVAGACTGLGIPPSSVGEVYGIFKAYCTRVGSGPFPTELDSEQGEKLRKVGHEVGATTGRPRRTGWLDLPALKYSVMINGVTQLFMMKADILGYFDEIKICTSYKMSDGEETEQLSFEMMSQDVEPVYKSFESWNTFDSIPATLDELPYQLKKYIRYIEQEVGVPITVVSIGPDRTETVSQ